MSEFVGAGAEGAEMAIDHDMPATHTTHTMHHPAPIECPSVSKKSKKSKERTANACIHTASHTEQQEAGGTGCDNVCDLW